MSASIVRLTLRAAAITIAVIALIDPAFSRTRDADRQLVAIVAAQGSQAVDRLRAAARGWDVVVRDVSDGNYVIALAQTLFGIALVPATALPAP